jgi:hypothetical protein
VAISCRGRKEFESFRLLSFRGSQVLALTEIGNGQTRKSISTRHWTGLQRTP